MKTKQNDCDLLLTGVENVFNNLGNCFESAIDDRKSKISVVKSIFRFGGSLTKLAFNTTTCAVRNVPKAVVAVASVKREVVTAIEEEYYDYQREKKEEALNEKINKLRLKA